MVLQATEPHGGPYSRPLDDRVNRLLEIMFASLHKEGLDGGGSLPKEDKKFTQLIKKSLDICGVSLTDVQAFNGVDNESDDGDDEEAEDD